MVMQTQEQFERELQGESLASRNVKTIGNLARKIPDFKQGKASSLIKQGKTIQLAPNYSKQQMALKQMFGGGEHIWGSGTHIYSNEGHLRRGVGLTNMDVRRETRRLFIP